jgi:hypothetical protein
MIWICSNKELLFGAVWSWSYGSMIYSYLCNQCLSSLKSFEFESRSWGSVLDTTLCDNVCKGLGIGRWFSPGTPITSTNKTDRHNVAEMLLKVALNAIHQTKPELPYAKTGSLTKYKYMHICPRKLERLGEFPGTLELNLLIPSL